MKRKINKKTKQRKYQYLEHTTQTQAQAQAQTLHKIEGPTAMGY